MAKGSADRLYEKCGSLRLQIAELEERYLRAVEALELLWLGDWSAVSGADTSSEYAGEILRNLGEDGEANDVATT